MDSINPREVEPPDLTALGKIFVLAHEDKRNLRTIGSGHLLIGLTCEEEKEIRLINQRFSIDRQSVEKAFDSIVSGVKRRFWQGHNWDQDFSEVLDLAIETGRRLNNGKVNPIHLLYAITKVPECTAMKVLRKMQVPIDDLERAIAESLSKSD